MVRSYWDIAALNNSDLTTLARSYNALPDNRAELEDIYNFGTLVDALLSEEHKVDYFKKSVIDGYGGISYSHEIFEQGETLARMCAKDPIIAQVIKQMVGQYIFVRNLGIEYEADLFTLRCKCKFDAYGKGLQMGVDYKTTSCRTAKQFREAVEFFHWDRQAAFYMDLGRIARHWIIGISKENGQVFKHAIERGDQVYELGRKKYSHWAYRWEILNLESFNPSPIQLITL